VISRVVQVFAPSGKHGLGRHSSGLVLAPGLVLTARHAVDGSDGDLEVRVLSGDPRWHACDVAWVGEDDCDAALLRVRGDEALGAGGPLRLGRLVGERRVGALRAVGFPWAQVATGERDAVDRTEAIDAAVDPLSGRAPGRPGGPLVVHVEGSVPLQRNDGGSPWEGMSGAALLRDDVVVGVIAGDPRRFGPDRLHATPASALVASPGFRAAAPVQIADVELLGLLEAPHRGRDDAGVSASPSQLIDSRAEVVGFRGREDELAALEAWCEVPAALGVSLVWGTGGIGKTRLAAELCHRVCGAGMVAGFYAPGADARAIAEVAPAQTTVLVIDEAHTMPGAVAEVLLAHGQRTAGGPVRVVVLARNAGDWWTHAIPDRVAHSPVASAACDMALKMELGPVAADPADRREAFLEAARAFRERLSPEAAEPDPEVPDLSGSEFDAILYVALAAARALEGDGAAQEGPGDLVAWALKREGRYWRATAAAAEPPLQVDATVLERAVAVATLTVADSEEEAAAALSAIPDLAGDARSQRAVARWLRHLYPRTEGDSWLSGLVPDVLGDALVAAVLQESPSITRGLLEEPSPDQAQSVLRVLDRAARSDVGLEALLNELVGERLRALWPAALVVSVQSGGPLASLVGRALAREPDPDLAREILAAIPDSTVALRMPAGVASEIVAGHLREAAQRDPAARPALADALNQYAVRSSDLGYLETALGAVQEAVALNRELAAEDPESARRLARTLASLANRCALLGRAADACGAGQEAVDLLRALDNDGPAAQLELGWALSQLSSDLGGVGRIDEALDAVQEALSILQPLFAATQSADVGARLASAYTNFSNRLTDAGYPDGALEATQRAVAVYRWLANEAPDAYEPMLAEALANIAIDLRAMGSPDEAHAAASEAVERLRRLDALAPGPFRFRLSHALNTFSISLSDLGRTEEALRASEEAVAIRRELVARHPGAFDDRLVEALRNLAIDLNGLGRREEALAARAEAMAITERLGER
jgi:tetratricopeptide (TPR) repeat protein